MEMEMGSVESRQEVEVKMSAQLPQGSQSVSWCCFSVFPLLSLSAGGACCLLLGARCSVSWGQSNNLNGQRVWKSCKRSLCDGNADDADEQEDATTVRGNQR